MARKINQAGLDIIRTFEGLRLDAYVCPGGILTIGYGHTGPDVTPGMRITQEHADKLLLDDIGRFERAVHRMAAVAINENQFSALVSFAFNLGENALRNSTLMRKLIAGDVVGAADEFPRWNKASGIVLQGLVRRRAAERELFLKGWS